MVENKQNVEEILREIRERVRKENHVKPAHIEIEIPLHPDEDNVLIKVDSALERMKLNLKTIESSWNSLPPVGSYRSGILARIELWLKLQIKRGTRWFTWKQVSFNSNVHQSLNELQTAIISQQQFLITLQQQVDSLHEITTRLIVQQKDTKKLRKDFNKHLIEIETSKEN
jgi:hypothetical protein